MEISKGYNADFLGKIGYDKSFTKAQMKGVSFVEYIDNETTNEIKDIWNRVKETLF